MHELSSRLVELRKKLNLTIEEISEKTMIRPHVLSAIEEGNFSVLPEVYIKSFVRIYALFVKIPEEEIDDYVIKIFGAEKKEIKPKPYSHQLEEMGKQDKQNYIHHFKKKYLRVYNQPIIVNYLIYTALGFAALALIYFTFFTDKNGSAYNESELSNQSKKSDTTEIKNQGEGLLSFFQPSDSLILEARTSDTAWIKIDIDGKFAEQALLIPNVDKRWSAKEYFVVHMGNAGAIRLIRNGKALEQFGTKGSVVRNLRITKDRVINAYTQSKDSVAVKKKSKKVQEKSEPPKIIEPSPVKTQPFVPKKKFN